MSSTDSPVKQTQAALSEKRQRILQTTAQQIGPIIQDCLTEHFRSLGLGKVDGADQEQLPVFSQEPGTTAHIWRATARIKTGSHSEYRSDGVHALDEQTAYSIAAALVVNQDCVPQFQLAEYMRSKLVGGIPVVASDFAMDIPSQLAELVQAKTGIKQVDRLRFLRLG